MQNYPREKDRPTEVIHVAVGVIRDEQDRFLIARRPAYLHQGGLWEFPGGKVEPGEDVERALKREIAEELGIAISKARPLIGLHYRYPDKSVYLDVWLVQAFDGEAHGREGQPVVWVPRAELLEYAFPEANRAILNCLRLPRRYLITGAFAGRPALLQKLEAALSSGIRLVQFRAPELDDETYARLAPEVVALARRYGAACLLNRGAELIERLDADGVHLSSTRLMALQHRPLGEHRWVAASVHNPQELIQAEYIGVDFAVIGAVQATASHPGIAPLGWEGFAALVREANIPCYALGGMGEPELERAHQNGAQGIAAISAWWPNSISDPNTGSL